MMRPLSIRSALRTATTQSYYALVARRTASSTVSRPHSSFISRSFATSPLRKDPTEKEFDAASTAAAPGESGDHEGRFARTDEGLRIEHPEEEHYPPSRPIQGRGGTHNLRTLASFSLEGKVGLVTGGARGLGLVMSQALVTSGAELAIVDMNSTYSICIVMG